MLVNEILKEVGMTRRAIKYYEEKGLLSIKKDTNGYRNYTDEDVKVLKKISDIQLTKSKLMLIKNLIGNLERLGIVHILVNDETIKSWVDPYEE